MKKRICRAMATAMVISLLLCQGVFAAGGLELVKAYPEEGSTGHESVNMMARLTFNGDVSSANNDNYFKIIGPDGKRKSILVLHPEGVNEQINIVLKEALEPNSEYEIVIDKNLSDKDGNTLGKETIVNFKTKDPSADSMITAVLMGVMMIGIVIMTIRHQSKQNAEHEKEERQKAKDKKVNPYKEAKSGKDTTDKKSNKVDGKKDNTSNKKKKK